MSNELPADFSASAYEEDPRYSLTFRRGDTYRHLSLEEVLGRGLNQFEGWHCAAGRDNLYITPDGNVYVATCKVNGYRGNVYEGELRLSTRPVICKVPVCVCGTDVQIRKAKNAEDFDATYEPPRGQLVQTLDEPESISPFPFKANWLFPATITWDIGRRCNYSCSYCHPLISNNFESHKTWGSLKFAIDNLLENFCRGRKTKWIFTGGEPTINPAYMDVVKYLTERGHLVHTQSNGSRTPDYFSELIEHSLLGFSLHLESFDEERFIKSCTAIIEKKQTVEKARTNWFGVRIMVPPGRYAEALRIKNRILAIPGYSDCAQVFMSPLYEREDISTLMKYESEELALINQNT